jgi:methionyl-tRNA synthetase
VIEKIDVHPLLYLLVPHIGHLYTVLLADGIKRWFDLKDCQTVLSTGTDEHGLKVL